MFRGWETAVAYTQPICKPFLKQRNSNRPDCDSNWFDEISLTGLDRDMPSSYQLSTKPKEKVRFVFLSNIYWSHILYIYFQKLSKTSSCMSLYSVDSGFGDYGLGGSTNTLRPNFNQFSYQTFNQKRVSFKGKKISHNIVEIAQNSNKTLIQTYLFLNIFLRSKARRKETEFI